MYVVFWLLSLLLAHLHPGVPVMPEPPVPAWQCPHADPEAPAFTQLLAPPEPGVSLN